MGTSERQLVWLLWCLLWSEIVGGTRLVVFVCGALLTHPATGKVLKHVLKWVSRCSKKVRRAKQMFAKRSDPFQGVKERV